MAKRKDYSVERTKRVFDDFFKVDEALVRHRRFDGQMSAPSRYLVLERGDSVAALLYNTDTKKIVLINQFRFATAAKDTGWMLETVAGILEEGERPEEAIRREIVEEAGYEAVRLEHIHTFFVSPGGSSERIILFYAEVSDASRRDDGGGLDEEAEDIEVLHLGPNVAFAKMHEGAIRDAKTLVALMWFQRYLQDSPD